MQHLVFLCPKLLSMTLSREMEKNCTWGSTEVETFIL